MRLSLIRNFVIFFNVTFLIFMFILSLFYQAVAGRIGGEAFIDILFQLNILNYGSSSGFSLWFLAGFIIPGFLYFVFLCYFWYRCYNNLRKFDVIPQKGKHWGWACMVVPILSLWMPINIGNEIKALNETSQKAWSVGLWWSIVILTTMLSKIFSHMDDMIIMANMEILSISLEIVALVMFVQISACFVKSQEKPENILSVS